jgi:hypothetical protein
MRLWAPRGVPPARLTIPTNASRGTSQYLPTRPDDVLADDDLNRIASGAELRHLYRMVVFESHGEYVTGHMFDITEQYRDLGGHLAFLSANDFFRRSLSAATR